MSDIDRLTTAFMDGRISRREFIVRGAALGLSLSSISWILAACGAQATASPAGSAAPASVTPSASGAAAAATPPPATPRPGGNLIIGYNEDITNLDPHLQSGPTWITAANNIWDTLTGLDPQTLKIIPRLATDWQVTDPTHVTFTLRDGVKFHTGAALTASDVKFSVARVQDPKTGSFWAPEIANIASVSVQDATHFTFVLSTPLEIDALTDALRQIRIVSAADGANVATKPNGTGPYQFAEWKKGDSLRLTKNASYWEAGLPYLDQITMKIISDAEALISALGAGDIDVLGTPSLKDVTRIGGMSGITILKGAQPQYYDVIDFNRTIPPFSDVNLRRMVMYAFDRQTYFQQFLGNQGTVQTTPFPTTSAFYNAQDANAYPFDLTKAQQALAAAGYSSSKPLSFAMSTIATGFPEWENASVMLQAALKQIGATVQIRKLELGTWVDELFKSTFTMTFDFMGGCDRDPFVTFYEAWPLRPGKSFAGTTQQDYTDILAKGSQESDPAQRVADYQQAAKLNNDQLYAGIIGLRNTVAAAHDYVQGYYPEIAFQPFRLIWRTS